MKYTKIFPAFLLFLIITLAGCEKNDSINGPLSKDDLQSLSKPGSNVQAVYTLSNSAAGNEVIMFKRSGQGTLTNAGSFSTGGLGTGAGLGSQGALVLDGNFVFAVNAGSNEVSVLSVGANGLSLVDKKPSGGTMPISVTTHGNLLYVLNAGGTGNITGFWINNDGTLSEIAGSTQPLSNGAAGPAQIEFNPDGSVLVVTEKANNAIDTYVVGSNGIASGPNTQASAGDTPFGFAFNKNGYLIVSDAFGGGALAGAMSSYNVSASGISLITGPVFNTQTAPCWVAVTKNGKFAYTTNTGSGNVSGYTIGNDGSLTLFNDGGNTGSTGTGSSPIDMAVSNNSQYLYTLNAGNSTISVFRINNGSGGLTNVETIAGLPAGSVGLAGN
jgi:6-phosphogluconolactonase (cycloisomerase 2 family)